MPESGSRRAESLTETDGCRLDENRSQDRISRVVDYGTTDMKLSRLLAVAVSVTLLLGCETAPKDPAVRAANRENVENMERDAPVTPLPSTPSRGPALHDGSGAWDGYGHRRRYGYW